MAERPRIARYLLPVLALVVSLANLAYTARTFWVSRRAYIGLVETDVWVNQFVLNGAPLKRLEWNLRFRNTGKSPARFEIEKNVTTIAYGGQTQVIEGPQQSADILVPGQARQISGWFGRPAFVTASSSPNADDLIAGRAQLTVEFRVRYESEGALFGTNAFFYDALYKLDPTTKPISMRKIGAGGD